MRGALTDGQNLEGLRRTGGNFGGGQGDRKQSDRAVIGEGEVGQAGKSGQVWLGGAGSLQGRQ